MSKINKNRISKSSKTIVLESKKMDAKSVDKVLNDLKTKNSKYWKRISEATSLDVFHKTAKDVPAYRDFLQKNKIDPSKIKTFEDFQKVPVVSKKNYLQMYKSKDLYLNGTLHTPLTFTSTSGSTGTPFYFSRTEAMDWQYSIMHELFFKNGDTKKSTLVIVGFGMGIWIGGTLTFRAYEMLGRRRNFPISVLPAGINKKEILNAFKLLSPNFEQTILIGYAPFLKEILDEASDEQINLKKINIRMTFAAEAFTENFRDHLSKKVGMINSHLDTMNIYGTADIGAVAFETPLSILIRRLAVKDDKVFKDIFGDIKKTPTLAQYLPQFTNIEYVNDEILITGNNSLPLVRYSIGDRGGVCTFDELNTKLKKYDIDLIKKANEVGISETITQLPFVFVFERNDLSTTLYGLQIYPETIREVLIKTPFKESFTGKFTMITKFDEEHNQYLEINLEQSKNKKVSKLLQSQLLKQMIKGLLEKNSEYRELLSFIKERAHPRLVIWEAEHPLHFKPGVKLAWVKKK